MCLLWLRYTEHRPLLGSLAIRYHRFASAHQTRRSQHVGRDAGLQAAQPLSFLKAMHKLCHSPVFATNSSLTLKAKKRSSPSSQMA